MFSMIIKSGEICTSVHLYIIIRCTDGMTVYMCPGMLLVIACVYYYWIYVHQQWYAYVCGYHKVMDNFYVIVHIL